MWRCPDCDEALQDQFRECWKCAGAAAAPPPEEPVPDLKFNGKRIPWAIAIAGVLVVLLLMESALLMRGNFSRLATADKIWMGLLAVTAIGIATRKTLALRASAVLLGLGVFLKFGVLFLSTASGGESFVREIIQILVTGAAAAVLIAHLRSSRTAS